MSEKTQQPSRHKLREARKRGEVAKSRELTSLASYVSILVLLWTAAEFFLRRLFSILERALPMSDEPQWLPAAQDMLIDAAWIVVPLLLVGMVAAAIVGAIQARGVFSFHPLVPKFEHINPAKGLKNLFSTRSLFELIKTLTKVTLLTAVLVWCTSASLDQMLHMVYAPALDVLHLSGSISFSLMRWAAVVYVLAAGMDYAHQHYEFIKQQRMSVEEVRQELREEEGDPWIRMSRRATARTVVYGADEDQSGSRSDKQNPTPRTV